MKIGDIAKMAGVSSAAVSRYLNGGPLSAEKRERIRTVVESTGYHPDETAQMLRTGRVNQIGVIVPKISSESVSQITAGIASELDESRYLMQLGVTGGNPEKELRYLNAMQRGRVAGIILMGTVLTPAHVEAFRTCKVPLVITGQRFPEAPCVYHDDRNAARELAARMLARGRRKIAYIGVSDRRADAGHERRLGIEDALREAGLANYVLPVSNGRFDYESGQQCMQELLSEHPEIDGVVCASDIIALGAFQVLQQAGISVPDQMSLAGIGDNWAGKLIQPQLTTVHLYQSQVGAEAARMLLQSIDRKEPAEGPVRQVTLGYTVIERGTI